MAGDAPGQPPVTNRPSDRLGTPPPWPTVIATTLRLFVQRRAAGVAGWLPASRKARRRALVAVLSALTGAAVAAAATDIVILARHPAARKHPAVSPADLAPLQAAAENRALAAAWITAQVSPSVIVACDPLMCLALLRDGFPAGDLDQLSTGAADPLGATVIVSTPTVRSQFGPRLASVYAPTVLASFGNGPNMVAVLATAPDGAAAYRSAAGADLVARQQAGAQLLHNGNVHVPSPAARAELAAGEVDSRLLITLAVLAHNLPVYVLAFGEIGPHASPGVPLRSMTISGVVPLARGGSYHDAVLAFLRAQQPPLPTTATVTRIGSATVLQITVTAPSPLGLLTAQPPS